MITNVLLIRGIRDVLLTKDNNKGYLPKCRSSVIQPIFATANMAIRKEVFGEIGLFDVNCRTGEDVDLSVRLSKTKWDLYFEPKAVVKHKHRSTLKELLKQWYGYGKNHPYIFKKHNDKCIKIYYLTPNKDMGWSSIHISRFLGLRVPLHTLIFITPFHMFNLFFALLAISFVLKLYWLAVILSMGVAYFGKRIFFSNLKTGKKDKEILYSLIRYIVNWTYVIGAFLGGLKKGVFYIEATREQIPM